MIDKEKLTASEMKSIDTSEIAPEMKSKLNSYFPVYFSENEEEAIEEVILERVIPMYYRLSIA
jgi:hypothetical protein